MKVCDVISELSGLPVDKTLKIGVEITADQLRGLLKETKEEGSDSCYLVFSLGHMFFQDSDSVYYDTVQRLSEKEKVSRRGQ